MSRMPELSFSDMKFNGFPPQARLAKRAEVPGGWLVMWREQMCFVPDPTHTWLTGEVVLMEGKKVVQRLPGPVLEE